MKRIVIFFVMLAASCQLTYAQGKEDWREKIMSEKIAFLTMEMGITPEEAQVFWPVYNQVRDERMKYHKAVHEAYGALQKALEGETVSDKDVDKLLDEYLAH